MTKVKRPEIIIQGAKTNNLKNVSLAIPHNTFIVVTGLSGSGKSSLVFDILVKEGQRRYFETLPSFARQFLGKLNRPNVDSIEGLSPVIGIGQSTTGMHARSTVGTMSDIYDFLRLLFARTGESHKPIELSRALFSFNSEKGKCPTCNGIGKEEQIDLNRLITHPERTIREGALAPTLPTGYIMYSQVTIDVLNQVCEAEGFNVDIPWNELQKDQREVILYGSEKIKVPFGKHSLESRLKWTGIKAKPREEGYYKGMIPIMSDILRRDRNANILKYVHAVTCKECNGSRLNKNALSVHVAGKSITELAHLELNELNNWLRTNKWKAVAHEIVQKITERIEVLKDLGLGHLTLDRSANTLSSSEIQRIRVANQITVPMSNVLYVFDEPSIGLHREENMRMIQHFKTLVQKGNTVIVVEHDLDTIAHAEYILDIGPKAGVNGGEILFNGALSSFLKQTKLKDLSPTYRALTTSIHEKINYSQPKGNRLLLKGCHEPNLKNIDVEFQLGKLNVVSGKSGVGKSSLVKGTLLRAVQQHLGNTMDQEIHVKGTENLDALNKLVFIDHTPIGKTPRSNPATYLGLSDHIRDVFAALPESKAAGFTKSRFSFNNKGGRCETCQGAGKTQIGMHFLGNVDIICGTCNGDRFNSETLQINYNGLSIADIYKLSVDQAISFFSDQKKVLRGLQLLADIGLGYLTLGQSSTTLSGGEAQRIKIANQLQKKDTGDTLYVIIEPSIGLHHADIQSLLQLFELIKQKGNTIVCIEQNEDIIARSDWHIELGTEGGKNGGQLEYQGAPETKPKEHVSIPKEKPIAKQDESSTIVLNGVTTHQLKNIDVRIPKNQLTVVTGVSGSGKSSLVYDTLFAEASARFSESLSAYNRSFIQQNSDAELVSHSGLNPTIGINRKGGSASKQSTVGTLSGVYDAFRLLYSRIAQNNGASFTAQHYSFNHHLGACEACKGLGVKLTADPDKIISDPKTSILEGAASTNKAVQYYSNPKGQFIATLKEAAKQNGWGIDRPWNNLEESIQDQILYGSGSTEWDVIWEYSTKSRSGKQSLSAKWLGLCNYIDDEYARKLHNKNIRELEDLLHEVECTVCCGSRLKKELLQARFLGKNIHELTQLSIEACLHFAEQTENIKDPTIAAISETVLPGVKSALKTLNDLGLGYLNLSRSIKSLSGGERQRITLAGQLSSHLFGVTYVLDEPTIGLDTAQICVLSEILRKIVSNGNTVVVVEHDPDFIRNADYLIELGPSAGHLGGELTFQGTLEALYKHPESLTYQLLHTPSAVRKREPRSGDKSFGVHGAFANNLKRIDVEFNSGTITAVTGVSGSGKSSLIRDTLFASWEKKRPVGCDSIIGMDQFEEVLLVDQTALHQNRLSTPASYTKILDQIKTVFSKTDAAKNAGLKKADFSYQSKNGKCAVCGGHGKIKTSMDFMSNLWLTCDECKGMRYNSNVLSCLYKGKSVGEVLRMTINEALEFFDTAQLQESLQILQHVGIGHLQLGQAGNTLSGGEAQRLKLAISLMQKRKGKTLYLFDEPSTGLHHVDILALFEVFTSIVERGDTILFIEHNVALIERSDKVIILGPGSGENGGELI